MMNIRQIVIDQIRAYCTGRSISTTRFGMLALNDPKFFTRLENGQVTLRSVERAQSFMAGPVRGKKAA